MPKKNAFMSFICRISKRFVPNIFLYLFVLSPSFFWLGTKVVRRESAILLATLFVDVKFISTWNAPNFRSCIYYFQMKQIKEMNLWFGCHQHAPFFFRLSIFGATPNISAIESIFSCNYIPTWLSNGNILLNICTICNLFKRLQTNVHKHRDEIVLRRWIFK